MVVCALCVIGALAAIVAAICFFFYADGDLTLLFAEKYGTPLETLSGKVVWITGASSGIGEGIAYKLAQLKCKLILSARQEKELHRVKSHCIEFGLEDTDVLVLPFDMVSMQQHQDCLNTVLEHFGKIDILVANAGRSQRATWESIEIEVDKELFELNVFSLVALSTLVLKQFLKRPEGGHFVVTSSITGKFGFPCSRSYCASKHALHGYFETLRIEHASNNIDVTMLCPGPVFSNILKAAFTNKAGETFGAEHTSKDKRMPAARCAHLCAVAIANKLDEVWISLQPILIGYYATQYFPSISRRLLQKFGVSALMKLRDNREVLNN